jgi:hypothetical protein
MAFLFSIALSVVFAVGFVVARDRLFPTSHAEGNAVATSTPTTAVAKGFQMEPTTKIVDIIEPTPTPDFTTSSGYDGYNTTDSHDDHDDDHHDHHDDEDHDD